MLEVLYDTATKEIRGWCGDNKQFSNFKPKEGQEIVILEGPPPGFESDIYYVDLEKQKVVGNPDYVPIEPFNPKTEIDSLKVRMEALEI